MNDRTSVLKCLQSLFDSAITRKQIDDQEPYMGNHLRTSQPVIREMSESEFRHQIEQSTQRQEKRTKPNQNRAEELNLLNKTEPWHTRGLRTNWSFDVRNYKTRYGRLYACVHDCVEKGKLERGTLYATSDKPQLADILVSHYTGDENGILFHNNHPEPQISSTSDKSCIRAIAAYNYEQKEKVHVPYFHGNLPYYD